MQDGSEYANPKFIHDWNELDWDIWFNTNKAVLDKLQYRTEEPSKGYRQCVFDAMMVRYKNSLDEAK